MDKLKLFKAGSIAFIILGLLHLLAHFGMTISQQPNQLIIDMQNYQINLFGKHSLFEFYNGFSIMMGFILAAFGLQNFFCAKFILQHKNALFSSLLISFVSFIIALIYFHMLAYGFILFSVGCYALSWYPVGRVSSRRAV